MCKYVDCQDRVPSVYTIQWKVIIILFSLVCHLVETHCYMRISLFSAISLTACTIDKRTIRFDWCVPLKIGVPSIRLPSQIAIVLCISTNNCEMDVGFFFWKRNNRESCINKHKLNANLAHVFLITILFYTKYGIKLSFCYHLLQLPR